MRIAASKADHDDCDSQQSERLSPPPVASLGRSGAGRVAKFVRSATCRLKARLDRTLSHGQQETKLIGTRAELSEKCRDIVVITEAMEQQQQQQDISPAQEFGTNIQVSHSCEPVASEKVVKPLVAAFSCPYETAQNSKRIIYSHEIGLEQSKKYLRKLNELLRSSHLADIVAISPAIERKATIIKFSHHEASSQAHRLNSINPTPFSQKSGSLQQKKRPSVPLTTDRDVDAGYAWVILAVIFIINASTFGIARAYGLIFDKLARDHNKSRSEAALPFTIMGAVENMAGPLSGYLLAQWSNSWRATVFAGSCLISLAHFLTAMSIDSQLGPLLSMGLLGGLGSSLVSISFFQLNNAYFVRYRSTAFGLGMTGAAFGTLYISPLCEYCLDNYGIGACYIMLGAILLPNVPLSLLLKPKIINYPGETRVPSIRITITDSDISHPPSAETGEKQQKSISISERVDDRARRRRLKSVEGLGVWPRIKRVVLNPMFHLIWPTQLLFCWLNFVFSMIIVDFGKDRGLSAAYLTKLVPCWAFGQLVGRLCLSSLVDFKCLSYKSFTVICLFCISITVFFVNSIKLPTNTDISADSGSFPQEDHVHLILLALIFCLSMFIALLYILFNGLVVKYTEPSLQSLSIGISSFAGSFFLLPRAYIIGLYRQTSGNYDGMLTMFSLVTLAAALVWLLLPPACGYLKQLLIAKRCQHRSRSRVIENLRVYSSWKLADQPAPICRHRDGFETSTHTLKVDIGHNAFCYNT